MKQTVKMVGITPWGLDDVSSFEEEIAAMSLTFDPKGRYIVQIGTPNSEQMAEDPLTRCNVRVHGIGKQVKKYKWMFTLHKDHGCVMAPEVGNLKVLGYNLYPIPDWMEKKIESVVMDLSRIHNVPQKMVLLPKFLRDERSIDQPKYNRLIQWITQLGKAEHVKEEA